MVFLFEITSIWQISWDFWFTNFCSRFFKIDRLVWAFLWTFCCFECVLSMFCLKLLVITKLKFYKQCFMEDHLTSIFYYRMVSCAPKKPLAMPYCLVWKIYSLERNPRLWLDNWLSLKTFSKIISVTSVSVFVISMNVSWSSYCRIFPPLRTSPAV